MLARLAALLIAIGASFTAHPVTSQTATDPVALVAPVLTIDPEALFTQSLYGQRIVGDIQVETEALATQNRDLAADLTLEEQDLAARRAGMDPAAFRAEAEAFDAKVQDIRAARDAKERALQDSVTAGRDQFFSAATPVLGQIMRDRGAVVLLDRRSVIISAGAVDITEQAVAAVDAALGDGSAPPAPTPTPDPTPEVTPAPEGGN